jgi:RHS repeat-associated protein
VWRTITEPSAGQAATVYDPAGTGNLYGEYFATDYREYVYLGGIPVASATDAGKAAPGINYLYADQLGTLRAVVSTSGTTNYTWPWLNNAFGDQPTQGTGEFYTRFPGQYFDVETGLEYNGARYYDSSTGRFPQADPAGLRGGINSYVYGLNDPLTYIDPTGLAPPGAPPPIGPFSPDPGPATTVTVNYYSGGLGHAGVSVNGDPSLGFYGDEDQTTELAFAFGFSGPGFIDEDQGTPSQSVTFYVTPEDAFEARNKLKKLFKNPGQYNLYKRNCASVAEDVLKSANISNVPNTMFPNALIRDLRNSQ